MKIRSALLIASGMLASILLITLATAAPASFRMPPSAPVVYVQPRTELLPPIAPPSTTTTTTVSPVVTTTTAVPLTAWDTVTPWEREAWTRVAVCEEGGFIGYAGAAYPDSLGISAVNWSSNGGWHPPNGVAPETPDWQIMVAMRIQTDPPDQGGCASW